MMRSDSLTYEKPLGDRLQCIQTKTLFHCNRAGMPCSGTTPPATFLARLGAMLAANSPWHLVAYCVHLFTLQRRSTPSVVPGKMLNGFKVAYQSPGQP